jgi:hypothetical protein
MQLKSLKAASNPRQEIKKDGPVSNMRLDGLPAPGLERKTTRNFAALHYNLGIAWLLEV